MAPHPQMELRAELDRLVDDVAAVNGFVFDAWGLVWCSATFPDEASRERLFNQIRTVLEGLPQPLPRGGKLDRVFADLQPPLYCRSFASIYVIALWTTLATNELALRRSVQAALPRIEALTLLLPPPTGNDPFSGAMGSRA